MKNMKVVLLVVLSVLTLTVSAQKGQEALDKLMDNWHLSASNADFEGYFGLMSSDFVFLGTAPEERWGKEEFAAFSKPYFDKGKAWDFKVVNRTWEFGANKKIIWFDENLDTWMKGCRGSGILIKEKGEWKIAYYNLTVLIENEKMNEFIELRD
jgi:hypothetical protein